MVRQSDGYREYLEGKYRLMANTKSANKRIRQTENQRARNRSQRSRMRLAVRKVRAAVEAGNKAEAQADLDETIRLVDATAGKGIIHRNAADRTKSRLVRAVARMDD